MSHQERPAFRSNSRRERSESAHQRVKYEFADAALGPAHVKIILVRQRCTQTTQCALSNAAQAPSKQLYSVHKPLKKQMAGLAPGRLLGSLCTGHAVLESCSIHSKSQKPIYADDCVLLLLESMLPPCIQDSIGQRLLLLSRPYQSNVVRAAAHCRSRRCRGRRLPTAPRPARRGRPAGAAAGTLRTALG